MFLEKRKFKNSKGLTLSAIYEGYDKSAPTVVICHGFASSKDSISQKDLSQKLIQGGLCVYLFDFTGCGQAEGKIGDLTPTIGLGDLKSSVKDLNLKNFALHGTSFGGYVALLYSSQNPVSALTLKCPVSDYPAVIKAHSDEDERGKILRDTININIYKRVQVITAPTLIIHGDADDVVPLDQSRKLIESLGSGRKGLKVIKNGPHTMRGEHMEEAHSEIVNFLRKTLLN